MGYAFRSDVYWCVANGRVVLLDLKADRYMALPNAVDAAVQAWLSGAPADHEALAALVDTGHMVTADTPPPASLSVPRPTSDLGRPAAREFGFERLEAWMLQLQTKHALRQKPLIEIVEAIRRRKAACTAQSLAETPRLLTEMALQYISSRRIISAQDECLRWSIAMVRYLARRRYFPELVLGVRMMPFAAHAWVQDGPVVLSDTAENVSAYTPILVV